MFVRLKLAGVATPATLAETENEPAVLLAVSCGAVATPSLPETAVAVAPTHAEDRHWRHCPAP